MFLRSTAVAALAGMVAVVSAPVATLAQDGGQKRFSLEKTESGFVRLDTETGALTLCRDEGGQLTCRMAADERAAYEKELDLLEKRVTALEKQGGTAAAKPGVPSEQEIETTLSIMERFMRRFFGLVQEFREEEQQQTVPNRT
ncbi:hypothetical protein [Neorhizobium sp. JUb45]|uniref:hypothetical protein n=1 Tax=unclassified Neorhizobium TaxID=2629175 RepID=UPI0010DA3A61|nr:hypothetical protein [Neorhizobium sp. JUb45]TCR02139.1 hypothetical protein EDF70_104420 [Neorhizobium sp. JUb45]